MHFAILCLLPVCLAGQPLARIHVYLAEDPHSLLVVVTMPEGSRAPAGVRVDLTDSSDVPIDWKLTDDRGEVEFTDLDPTRYSVLQVSAEKGSRLRAQGVEVQWRAYVDRKLRLLPETRPSDATRKPVCSVTTTKHCPPCEPSPCCRVPCCYRPCFFDRSEEPCCWQAEPRYLDISRLPDSGEARLTVSVPSDAIVFINGKARKLTGNRRLYISKGLMYGCNYTYVVQARIVRNGKTIEDSKTVVLRLGDSKEITLDFSNAGN